MTKRAGRLLLPILGVGVFTGCGLLDEAKTKEQKAPGAPFLAFADFAAIKPDALDKAGVKQGVAKLDTIFANEPDSASEPSELDKCLDALATDKVTATDTLLTIGLAYDGSDCISKEYESVPKFEVSRTDVRFFGQYECSTGGLSQFDGKTLTELGNSDFECNGGEGARGASLWNTEVDMAFSFETDDGGIKSFETIIRTAEGATDTTGCAGIFKSGTYTSEGQCFEYSSEVGNTNGDPKASMTKLSFQNVTAGAKDLYYRSGTVGISMNNWQGTLTYTGATKAPTYTMTNGTETVSDTFAYSDGESPSSPPPEEPSDIPQTETPEDTPVPSTLPPTNPEPTPTPEPTPEPTPPAPAMGLKEFSAGFNTQMRGLLKHPNLPRK